MIEYLSLRKATILAIHLLMACVLTSCSVGQKVNYKQIYQSIQEAQANNDVMRLMELYVMYPEYEEYLSHYLTDVQKYDTFSYNELIHYVEKARETEIPQLYEDMKYIRSLREQRIEDSISGMTIDQLGKYYFSHGDEKPYLDSLLITILSPVIDDADYVTLRQIHNAFPLTPIGDYAENYYVNLRSTFLEMALDNLEEYFESEIETLEYVKNQIIVELDEYIQSVVNSVVSYCFNNKLSWFKSDVNGQADRILKQFYDSQEAERIVLSNIKNFATEARYARESIVSSLLQGVEVNQNVNMGFQIEQCDLTLLPKADYVAFMNLRNAQRKIDWFGVGLTAASFAVAWPAGILVDVADIAYGLHSDKVKEEAIENEFNSFIPAVYNYQIEDSMRHFNSFYTEVVRELIQSQEFLKDYVQTNF